MDLAKQIHDLEQMTGYFRQVASWVASYHRSLIEEGMTEQSALMLTCAHQQSIMNGSYYKPASDDKPPL